MKKREFLDEQFLLDTIESAGRPLRLDDILRIGGFSRKLKREVIATLHDLAGEGRLAFAPGMYVMPDMNMVDAESLFLLTKYGKRFLQENFGRNISLWKMFLS